MAEIDQSYIHQGDNTPTISLDYRVLGLINQRCSPKSGEKSFAVRISLTPLRHVTAQIFKNEVINMCFDNNLNFVYSMQIRYVFS